MSHKIINSKAAARRQRDHEEALRMNPRANVLAWILAVGAQQKRDREQPPKMGRRS